MNKISKLAFAALPAFVAALPLTASMPGSAVAAESAARDLTVEQTTAANAGTAKPGSLKVSVASDHADGTYAIGEVARLFITTNEDAYVTVVNVGPSGQVTQLFPNQYQPDNHVTPGRPLEIAGGQSGGRIAISGPVGHELVKVIASNRPLTVINEAQLQGSGVFRSVEGGVPTLARNLEVVAKPADGVSDRRISLENFTLTTVATRLPSAAQPVVLVAVPPATPTPAQAPAQGGPTVLLPVVAPPTEALPVPAVHAFPLLMAVDKPAYKVGESVTLAVTSLQSCYLTVLDVTPGGAVRVLFPNRVTPNNAVSALQTVLVAGTPSPVSLTVAAPTGTENVVALCSTDASPILTPAAPQGTETFPLAGDRADVARNLSVAAARPAGSLSTASLSFAVSP